MKQCEQKSTSLGIELGSTRIKAVLAGPDGSVLASGAHDWENHSVSYTHLTLPTILRV